MAGWRIWKWHGSWGADGCEQVGQVLADVQSLLVAQGGVARLGLALGVGFILDLRDYGGYSQTDLTH